MTQLPNRFQASARKRTLSMNASVPFLRLPRPSLPRRLCWLVPTSMLSVSSCFIAQAQPAGTIVGWGNNSSLQLQIPPGLTSAIGVAAGSAHSLALKTDGTVVGWGLDVSGQADPPLDLAGVTSIQAGPAYSLALKNDQTVVSWGDLSLPA